MTTTRLSLGHLPERLEQERRNLSANAQAFECARPAQRDWRHVPFAARKRIFSRFHDDVLKTVNFSRI